MTTFQIIIGILCVAAVTAVLYAWGLHKSLNRQQDLDRRLISVCGNRVVKKLKKQSSITEDEVAALIKGTTAGPIWSHTKAKVEQAEVYAPKVIAFLLEQLYIEKIGPDRYRLR